MKIKNIPEDHEGGAHGGALMGFFAAAGFVFSLSGATGLFSEVPLKLHLIDNGYHVAGLIIGWWA